MGEAGCPSPNSFNGACAVRRASYLPAGGGRDAGLPHILPSLIFLFPSPFPVSFCSPLFLCFLPEFSLPKFSSLSSTALAPFVILPSPLLFPGISWHLGVLGHHPLRQRSCKLCPLVSRAVLCSPGPRALQLQRAGSRPRNPKGAIPTPSRGRPLLRACY